MPQYFPPNASTFAKWSILGAGLFIVILVTLLDINARGAQNQVGVPIAQPVPFPHNLHAGELGIDCRYCHTSVETSSFPNLPPTEVCMTCHSQIRVGTPQLAVVQKSWETGVPIQWNKVDRLAGFAYFNHSIHVAGGIGCSTCHGRVDEMPGIWKTQAMSMGWCLQCHKNPAAYIRPKSEVFNMAYQPPTDQLAVGRELVKDYHIDTTKLIQCSTCHR